MSPVDMTLLGTLTHGEAELLRQISKNSLTHGEAELLRQISKNSQSKD